MTLLFEHLFHEHILDRGCEYFMEGKVEDIHQDNNVYSATVQGTQPYHVEIELKGSHIQTMKCDCPYAQNNRCKHMAAVLCSLTEDNDAQDETVSENHENEGQGYIDVLRCIPTEELLSFLATKMKEEVAFENELKSKFPTYFEVDVQSYVYEWECIVNNAQDRSGFIDYHHSFDFQCNASVFFDDIQALSSDHPLTCFHICTSIYYDLAQLEIDDSGGETTTLAKEIQDIISMILKCGKSEVIQEVRAWLEDSMDDPILTDYCLEEGFDVLLIESTPLNERIIILKDLLANQDSQYDLHCGKYIDYLIQVFQERNMNDEEIYEELLEYDQFTPARNWIIHYLLNAKEIDQAIAYIKEGHCLDDWETNNYAKWLLDVYKQNGYDKEYEIEVRVYIASGANDAFDYYKKYRDEVGETKWICVRDQILHSIKDNVLLGNCYYVERMPEQLSKILDAKEIDFFYLQKFEDLLLEYDNAWVLAMYCRECDALCGSATNQNYEQIAGLLSHLKKLPKGEQLANDKRDELLVNYRRRRNLVDLLKKV